MASGLEGARVVSGRKLVLGMVGAVLLALGVYVVYRIDGKQRQAERRAAEEARRRDREAARALTPETAREARPGDTGGGAAPGDGPPAAPPEAPAAP
jgi:hypothetical protein